MKGNVTIQEVEAIEIKQVLVSWASAKPGFSKRIEFYLSPGKRRPWYRVIVNGEVEFSSRDPEGVVEEYNRWVSGSE